MALDKQRILSELGSVMTQLQSADCGCMGKLFSNSSGGHEGAATGNPQPTGRYGGFGGCMHGCCHGHGGCNYGHGAGTPGAGEPYPQNGPCMGKCNPRKIYADTYSYLNNNLMQPVVKEVYNDLKSITPENTVMNNAMAAKMGLSPQAGNPMKGGNAMHGGNTMQGGHFMQGQNAMQGDMGLGMEQNQMMGSGMFGQTHGNVNMPHNQMPGNNDYSMQEIHHHQMQGNAIGYQMQDGLQDNAEMSQNQMQGSGMGNQLNMSMNNQKTNQKLQHMMGGMGPQIVNMMKGDSSSKRISSPPQEGQMPGTMLIDAPQSPHGKLGVTPLNSGGMNLGQFGQYNTEGEMSKNSNQQMYDPTTQYVTDPNMSSGFNPNSQNYNAMNANMKQGQANVGAVPTSGSNPTTQQMAPANRNYGQHSQGMTKFNEMFPGVMQGMGGDLGFDPMAIAIQMNPGNQKRAAMDTMQKMMSGNKAHMNTAIAGANAASENITQGNTAQTSQPGQPGSAATPMVQNQQYGGNINTTMTPAHSNQTPQQQIYNANQITQQQGYDTNKVPHQQSIYTSLSGAPMMNQEHPHQQMQAQQQQQYQYQQQVDPNTGTPIPQTPLPVNQGATGDTNAATQEQQHQNYSTREPIPEPELLIQDPIFPVDTSKYQPSRNMRQPKYYQYNTLGQPIEVLPARLYQSLPETSLPQTLSPQPITGKLRNDISRLNIKSTVSKTALMTNRPVGRTPSRSQLQNIYNQYKGSHSYTQQNIRDPIHSDTHSEGKARVQPANVNQVRSVPVERVGGDTAANNQAMINQAPVKGQPIQHIGDVPVPNKPHGDVMPTKEPPVMQGNVRNGLQDMTYTSYPTSAAWSFHGHDRVASYPSGYRYRNRV